MNKAFEKILERLEEEKELFDGSVTFQPISVVYEEDIRKIVHEVAEEYEDGWIPCSERLPEEAFGCLVTVMDCEPSTQTDFENILLYFVGYDGHRWNDADGEEIPFEVIAWQPVPEPYKERD